MAVSMSTANASARTLSELLPGRAVPIEIPVTGISYDSRTTQSGDIFFALPGAKTTGVDFARAAVQRGAVAVVAPSSLDLSVPVIVADEPRKVMAEVSHRFYGFPDRTIDLIGVTGTNGKSTVAAGLQTIWEIAGIPAGLFGTLFYRWANHSEPASRTTPEAPDLDRLLARMRQDGVKRAVMEVSSHAIVLDRVWGLHFKGGIFTNITRDHLDFHHTFENYRGVKRIFFERLSGTGVFAAINVEDPNHSHFITACPGARVILYSGSGEEVDVHLAIVAHDLDGTQGRLLIGGESWPFRTPLWGRFNHANLAAIAAGAYGSGIDGGTIARGLSRFAGITGRAERVPSAAPFPVFVDYAHTPDALDAVLSAARPLVRGRLIVLFGCGGDRDRGKRPEMAQAVEHWADQIILTSDNPRSEDPDDIIREVQAGFTEDTKKSKLWMNPDRARAIDQAVKVARAGDAVFLCGKGHEDYQEVAGSRHHFLDHEEAQRALKAAGFPPVAAPPGGDGS